MSDQGYTPTTEEVLDSYRRSIVWARGSGAQSDAEFDRWLAEVRREAAEEAWDRATDLLSAHYLDRVPSAVDRLERSNPYRKEATDD